MSRRDPQLTLAQIRDAAEKTRALCATHTLDSLLADWTATAALERCIEIVVEGVRRLPPELKQQRDDIPWKDIAGTRDRLIHGYDLVADCANSLPPQDAAIGNPENPRRFRGCQSGKRPRRAFSTDS